MKKLNVLITVACLLVWLAPDAMATGFGFYGTFGKGTIKLDNWERSNADPDDSPREDTEFVGAGMVLDSAVALNRVFNYRLNVGYEKLKVDFDLPANEINLPETGLDQLESIVIDQDFGLAVYRSDLTRIWFGPELRVFFSHDELGMGIGPVLGINLHTGREATVALKLGFLFSEFADGSFDSDYEKESHAFLNLAILFRSEGDRFHKHAE
jgi:opacity protein-like surface antigen